MLLAAEKTNILSPLKALSDETRLRILRLLSTASLNVNEITEILQMGQSRISRHLKILSDAGLISYQREGSWVYYKIPQNHNNRFQQDIVQLLIRWKEQLPGQEADNENTAKVLSLREERRNKYFNAVSNEWENLQTEVMPPSLYRERLVSMLPEFSGNILDAGCGTGQIIPYLLPKASRILGVDSSHKMIEAAKTHYGNNPDVEFIESSLENMPLPSASVDVVVCSMVLHHASNPAVTLKEFSRVLKKGGVLCIVDLDKHEQEYMRNNYADLWLGFDPAILCEWLDSAGFAAQILDEIKTKSIKNIPESNTTLLDVRTRFKILMIKAIRS